MLQISELYNPKISMILFSKLEHDVPMEWMDIKVYCLHGNCDATNAANAWDAQGWTTSAETIWQNFRVKPQKIYEHKRL